CSSYSTHSLTSIWSKSLSNPYTRQRYFITTSFPSSRSRWIHRSRMPCESASAIAPVSLDGRWEKMKFDRIDRNSSERISVRHNFYDVAHRLALKATIENVGRFVAAF